MEKTFIRKIYRSLNFDFVRGFFTALLVTAVALFVLANFSNNQVVFHLIEKEAVVEQCVKMPK